MSTKFCKFRQNLQNLVVAKIEVSLRMFSTQNMIHNLRFLCFLYFTSKAIYILYFPCLCANFVKKPHQLALRLWMFLWWYSTGNFTHNFFNVFVVVWFFNLKIEKTAESYFVYFAKIFLSCSDILTFQTSIVCPEPYTMGSNCDFDLVNVIFYKAKMECNKEDKEL